MQGTLKKIISTHNNLRTPEIEGEFEMPVIGECFELYGEGLYWGTRIVQTTEVQEIKEISKDTLEFKTLNSTYNLEIIKK